VALEWVFQFSKKAFDKLNENRKAVITWAQWQAAGRRYGERLERDYGKLTILGKQDPLPMADIYTTVNVLEKVAAFQRYAPEELQERFLERATLQVEERRNGIELVNENKDLFILGKPGAGKTTFLKHVAIKAAKREIDPNAVTKPVPIFISLKAHTDAGRTLPQAIQHELEICKFPESERLVEIFLNGGEALILLDGLDEVSRENNKRTNLIQEIDAFMRKYNDSQFIISCRVAAADFKFPNASVSYLEMSDFDDEQVRTYINNWFQDKPELGTKCWQELQRPEHKGLKELAQTPLLLGLLCITYEDNLTFPARRIEIYQDAIDILLKRWDNTRMIQRDEPYRILSPNRKKQMLARIAQASFEDSEFLLPRRDLAKQIEDFMQTAPEIKEEVDGEVVVQAIGAQHGMFVERSYGYYSYAHLSFQEYFTAEWFAKRNRLDQLLTHIENDQWQEIFLLTSSLLEEDDAKYFFFEFSQRIQNLFAKDFKIQQLLQFIERKVKYTGGKTRYKNHARNIWFLYHTLSVSPETKLTLSIDISRYLAKNLLLVNASNILLDHALMHTLNLNPINYSERSNYLARFNYRISHFSNLETTEREKYEYSDIYEVLIATILDDNIDANNKFTQLQKIKESFEVKSNFTALMYSFSEEEEQEIASMTLSAVGVADSINQFLEVVVLFNNCLDLAMVTNPDLLREQVFKPFKS